MEQSSIKFKNRYGTEYYFEQVNENTYTIVGDFKYWRFGGQIGESVVSRNNLGFADPDGGPFISKGFDIYGRQVKRIYETDDNLYFEVE